MEAVKHFFALWCIASGLVCFSGVIVGCFEWCKSAYSRYLWDRRERKLLPLLKSVNVLLAARNHLEFQYQGWASFQSRGDLTPPQAEAVRILKESELALMREIQAL